MQLARMENLLIKLVNVNIGPVKISEKYGIVVKVVEVLGTHT